jgi:hypothetical protein
MEGEKDSQASRLPLQIIHRAGAKHANVDALNKNPVGNYEVDEDFGNEIEDLDRLTLEISMFSAI